MSVTTANVLMRTQERCVEGMANVIAETVTVLPVGMETNVTSSVTSARGKASEDARLQMAKSAATEERVCAESVTAMMWIPLVTGEIYTVTPASVMRGAVMQLTIDTQTTSAQVTASVTVVSVVVRRDGPGRSVNIRCPAPCLWRAV